MKLKTTAILTLALAFAAPVMAQHTPGAIEEAARKNACQFFSAPDPHPTDFGNGGKPFTDQQLDQLAAQLQVQGKADDARSASEFAAQMGISREQAHAALDHAAGTMGATWDCLSDGSIRWR